MHGAEDDPMFDGPQQFFVGFQEGLKTVKIGWCDLESRRVRSIPPTSDTMAALAIALIDGFAACDIGRITLRVKERREEDDKSHA
jgi:hypothetical protein